MSTTTTSRINAPAYLPTPEQIEAETAKLRANPPRALAEQSVDAKEARRQKRQRQAVAFLNGIDDKPVTDRAPKRKAVAPVPLEPSDRHYIAGNLRRLLADRGMFAHQLAGIAGIDWRIVSKIAKGSECPTTATVQKLAVGLGVPLEELLGHPLEMTKADVCNVEFITFDELAEAIDGPHDALPFLAALDDVRTLWAPAAIA